MNRAKRHRVEKIRLTHEKFGPKSMFVEIINENICRSTYAFAENRLQFGSKLSGTHTQKANSDHIVN